MNTDEKKPMICDPETGVCEIPSIEPAIQDVVTREKSDKPIRIVYYTDPICSSCWGIEPQLRKLKLEYGHLFNFEYRMGGLLPNWNYNSGGINKPEDVAHHWDEASHHYQMPIDGDIWLEDPLHSSYPPSIAFKAAQMQDGEKAIGFLRRLRELLFVEKKNITKWEYIAQAGTDAQLDMDQLKKDYTNGKAETLFQEDLALGREFGVRGFPSIFFVDRKGNQEFVYGSKSYKDYELALKKLLPIHMQNHYYKSWENLFTYYSSFTVKEFSVLSEVSLDQAQQLLDGLAQQGKLKLSATKNGNLYHVKRL